MKPYSSAFAFSYLLSLAIIVSTRHYEENSSNRKLFFKLRGEDQTHQTSRMSRRKQCTFKDKPYSIGDRWSPDFGPDFGGIQHCIICECLNGLKKNSKGIRRSKPKIMCSNFAKQCPEPKCSNPMVYPGRCCKSCSPDDEFEQRIRSRYNLTKENSGSRRKRNFYTILTSDGKPPKMDENAGSNWAYMHLKNGTLHFFIETTGSERPNFVNFIDLNDTRNEEFSIEGNATSNHNFRVYGSWDMTQHQRQLLFTNQLKMAISFNSDSDSEQSLVGLIQHTSTERKFNIHKFKLNSLNAIVYNEPLERMPHNILGDEAEQEGNSIEMLRKCTYEGKQYEEGEQWPNERDQCERCSCQRGKAVCEIESCMTLNCTITEQIRLPDQCCPVCKRYLQANQSCEFNNRKYLPGSKWNPFIPPNGFDRCITCSCNDRQRVNCQRKKCPPLQCSQDDSKLDELGCCRVCANQPNHSMVNSTWYFTRAQHDMPFDDVIEQQRLNEARILRDGGCRHQEQVYANGAEWNPNFGSFGPNKCIVCKCNDGVRGCKAINCPPQPNCPILYTKRSECCPVCSNDQSTGGRKLRTGSKQGH